MKAVHWIILGIVIAFATYFIYQTRETLATIREWFATRPPNPDKLAEFRAEDRNVPIKPLHKMSKKQILKEFGANGFKLVDRFDRLPWQHMLLFGKQ